jgi:hypothetical protein
MPLTRRRARDPGQSERVERARRRFHAADREERVEAAWLLRAITLIDLTTLSGDDTPGTCDGLCAKAGIRCATTSPNAGVKHLDIKVGACASITRS